jgi:hypothetical protein
MSTGKFRMQLCGEFNVHERKVGRDLESRRLAVYASWLAGTDDKINLGLHSDSFS